MRQHRTRNLGVFRCAIAHLRFASRPGTTAGSPVNPFLTINTAKIAQWKKLSVVSRVKTGDCPWTPVRCLTFETVGPSAAAQSFGARDRHSRGEAAVMVGRHGRSGRGSSHRRVPEFQRNPQYPVARRSWAGVRHPHHPGGADPAAALDRARSVSGDLDHAVDPDPDDVAVHPGAAGILVVSDHSSDLDHAAAVAQPRLDAADPVARP